MTDHTAWVQGFIDRGERIPAGTWDCPDGLSVPGGYIARARAAGREPDAPDGGFCLAEPEGARISLADGFMYLGYMAPGEDGSEGVPLEVGRNGCALTVSYGTTSVILGGFGRRYEDGRSVKVGRFSAEHQP